MGNRKEGYVRLTSDGSRSIQARWQSAKAGVGLKPKLHLYLDRLAKDSRKAKTDFRKEVRETDGRLEYRWQAEYQGRGVLFFDAGSDRVFFLEAVGPRKDSLLPTLRQATDSFTSVTESERELWSLCGFGAWLPKGLKVSKKQFLAGRTTVELEKRWSRVHLQRWAFAEQLIAKHGLGPWARAALALPAEPEPAEEGLVVLDVRNVLRGRTVAMVRHAPSLNQIEALVIRTRSDAWRPDPTWFA